MKQWNEGATGVVANYVKAFGLGHLWSAIVVERCVAPSGRRKREWSE